MPTDYKTDGDRLYRKERLRRRAPFARDIAGMILAPISSVRFLEARFYPASKDAQAFVTVGRVRGDQRQITIEPAESRLKAIKRFDTRTLRAKLESLVSYASADGDPFDSLLELRSEFWSFVEMPPRGVSGLRAP